MKIVILGLSITSSWGNGHATTYRALVRELSARGHDVLFLERDLPWYADNRDVTQLPPARIALYQSLSDLQGRHAAEVAAADAVIVGSFVPDGAAVGNWVLRTAGGLPVFYDIDTPVTLAGLSQTGTPYLSRELVRAYALYLSFTGGPTLRRLEEEFGSPRARPLYCSVDPGNYFPEPQRPTWDLGYLGTYSRDRHAAMRRLLLTPAQRWTDGRFAVAGAQYPKRIAWPPNVARIEHLPPARHRRFYNRQRFTLNLTRADMIAAGYSPSVRLFEAAACGTPIISDSWPGLEEFFEPDREILIAHTTAGMLDFLRDMPAQAAESIGAAARRRVMAHHTAAHRAAELEQHLREARRDTPVRAPLVAARERVSA
jgi:spore maturation protein CgeB